MTVRNFFGGTLFAIGALIMFLTGACTLYFGPMMLLGGNAQISEAVLLIFTFGVLPFSVGLIIWFVGKSLIRRRPQQLEDDTSGSQDNSSE